MSYVDGFVIPVPSDRKAEYQAQARAMWPLVKKHGALHVVECWGDDLPHGKMTDFFMATKAEPGETIVFSWVVWPSKATRDAGNARIMEEWKAMPNPPPMPFDGKRMIIGGFDPIFESDL